MLYLQDHGLHGALCDDMGLGKTLQVELVSLFFALQIVSGLSLSS